MEGYRYGEPSETQTQTTAAEAMPCTLILSRKESLWTAVRVLPQPQLCHFITANMQYCPLF